MASPTLPTGAFANAQQIYQGLLGFGLNANAAAGVAGNIYQESHGNPGSSSSAGGGLFGLTVGNGGTVNGGTLTQQLQSLLAYIQKNGSIADINAHASNPVAAADWFSNQYERPGIPALSNREDAALWVAQQFGNLSGVQLASLHIPNPLGALNPVGASGVAGSVGGAIAGPIESIGNDFVKAFFGALGVSSLKDLLQRLGLVLLGVVLIIVGINQLSKTGGGSSPINITTSENTDESTGYTTKSKTTKTPLGKSTSTSKTTNEYHYSNGGPKGASSNHHGGGKLVKSGEGGLASDAIKAAASA